MYVRCTLVFGFWSPAAPQPNYSFARFPPNVDTASLSLRERRDVLLDDALDLRLHVARDVSARNLRQQRGLRRGQVSAELGLPLGDLVDGDGVELREGKGSALCIIIRRREG